MVEAIHGPPSDPFSGAVLGPTAQDFHATFGLGSSDRTIQPVDANGVLMLSIQALYRGLGEVREGNLKLHRENTTLRKELVQLREAARACSKVTR